MKFKKILCMLMAFCLISVQMPATVWAGEASQEVVEAGKTEQAINEVESEEIPDVENEYEEASPSDSVYEDENQAISEKTDESGALTLMSTSNDMGILDENEEIPEPLFSDDDDTEALILKVDPNNMNVPFTLKALPDSDGIFQRTFKGNLSLYCCTDYHDGRPDESVITECTLFGNSLKLSIENNKVPVIQIRGHEFKYAEEPLYWLDVHRGEEYIRQTYGEISGPGVGFVASYIGFSNEYEAFEGDVIVDKTNLQNRHYTYWPRWSIYTQNGFEEHDYDYEEEFPYMSIEKGESVEVFIPIEDKSIFHMQVLYCDEDGNLLGEYNGEHVNYWENYFMRDDAFVNELCPVTNIYSVNFNSNGHGTAPASQQISAGGKVSKPSDLTASGYTFGGWYKESSCVNKWNFDTDVVNGNMTLYAKWTSNGSSHSGNYSSGGSGGGGGSVSKPKTATGATYSPNWIVDASGVWKIRNSKGELVKNAWLCDDVITANGQNVWYLLQADGSMLSAGLVQDNTGNFYSFETNHTGYFGMMRYKDGYYDCNGQQVYLKFNQKHDNSFGAVINKDGLEKLKQIYGITKYPIGNETCTYTSTF